MPDEEMTLPLPTFTEQTSVRPLRGHTLGAIEDGWLLYYEANGSRPTDAIDGKFCIVRTADHRILARKVRKSWQEGRWDLTTVNGEQLVNQELVWAELVTLIQPHTLTEEEKRQLAELGDHILDG